MQVKHTIKIYSLTGIILLCAFLVPSIVVARVYTPAPQPKSVQDNSGIPSSKTDGGINNHPQFQPSQTSKDPSINSNNLSQLSQVNQNGFVSDAKHTLNGIIGFFKGIYNDVKDVATSVVKSIWNWIVPPIKEVKYNDHISIKGTKDFINITKDNLKKIEAVEPGKEILQKITSSKYHVTILEGHGIDDDESYPADDDKLADALDVGKHWYYNNGDLVYDKDGNLITGNGKGTDAIVKYDTNLTFKDLPKENNCGDQMTVDAIFFHELTHASHTVYGKTDMTPIKPQQVEKKILAWSNQEEKNTIMDDHPNEADYLISKGIKFHRIDHTCSMVPN